MGWHIITLEGECNSARSGQLTIEPLLSRVYKYRWVTKRLLTIVPTWGCSYLEGPWMPSTVVSNCQPILNLYAKLLRLWAAIADDRLYSHRYHSRASDPRHKLFEVGAFQEKSSCFWWNAFVGIVPLKDYNYQNGDSLIIIVGCPVVLNLFFIIAWKRKSHEFTAGVAPEALCVLPEILT